MTWGDLKRAIEAAGVRDDHVVGFFDLDPPVEGDGAADIRVTIHPADASSGAFFEVEDAE